MIRRAFSVKSFSSNRCIAALTISACLCVSGPALADAIDGAWCKGAQSLTITGPTIVTPSGAQLAGDYSRHGYRYVAPQTDPDAGSEVDMTLVQEDRVEVVRRRQGTTTPAETWLRCKPIS